jgi:hypothetical protein
VLRLLHRFVTLPEFSRVLFSAALGGTLRGDADGITGGAAIDVWILVLRDAVPDYERSLTGQGVDAGAELLFDGDGQAHGLFSLAYAWSMLWFSR